MKATLSPAFSDAVFLPQLVPRLVGAKYTELMLLGAGKSRVEPLYLYSRRMGTDKQAVTSR